MLQCDSDITVMADGNSPRIGHTRRSYAPKKIGAFSFALLRSLNVG